jgi:predicted DNA-binding protein
MARIQKYPSQISALIPAEHYERLKAIELAHPVSLADVIREAIKAGLPSVEAKYAAEQPQA